jgi:hypothetical protein
VGTAHADSIRNTVRDHVKKGLDGPKKEDPPKPAPQEKQQPPKPENKDAKPAAPKPAASSSGQPPQQAAPGEAAAEKSLASTPKPAASNTTPATPPPTTAPPTQAAPARNKNEPHSGATFTLEWGGSSDSKNNNDSKEAKDNAPKGPPIPQRIFGTNLKLDPKFGGGLRGWIPAQYPTVKTSADIYYTWSVDVSGSFFRYINLHRGYFESNGLAAPRHQGAAAAVEAAGYAKKAAWLLGVIGVPITKQWEPVVIYETRAFQTRAIPQRPVRIVPFNTSPDVDLRTIPLDNNLTPLTMVSGFETFVVAMRYNQSGQPATVGQRSTVMPPFYFGLGLIQYSKPYQVTVGDSVLDSVLFDARFRGAGLALGTNLPGKPDYLILDASVQFGLGEVRLLDKLTLNELLPNTPGRSGLRAPEWIIGYLEGNLSLGYLYALLKTKPTVLVSAVANGGGARFAYIKTRSGEGESVNMPSLNWDFLWGLMGYVTIPL